MKIIFLATAVMLLLAPAAAAQSSTNQVADSSLHIGDTAGHEEEEDLEEVQISSTRSNRSISDIPTRVEFIAGEELDEKANMKPGDIRMLLAESTGIQTQQTSATSANASIRIQGLDGRYTQVLKDGFPLYTGAAGGLGLLQTPPLDLKQAEVVKGSASTLYGGGAIAGLVNLISKTPGPEDELHLLLNGTSAGGLDVNGFYSARRNRFGTTLYAARNSNAPYDPAGIGFTAIPKFSRYTFNPRLYYYPNERTTLMLGLNTSFEERTGGNLDYVRGKAVPAGTYFERNDTRRLSGQFSLVSRTSGNNIITLKASYSHFDRRIGLPGYVFPGLQQSVYSEASFGHDGERLDWVAGTNFISDVFKDRRQLPFYQGPLSYSLLTPGVFAQATWRPAEQFAIEGGLRGDYVMDFGPALLPRFALLFRPNTHFASRLGGGLGYKAPTIFTEETERIQYRDLYPSLRGDTRLERSYGANWDLNYRTSLFKGSLGLSVNQLFFYTRINSPLVLGSSTFDTYYLYSSGDHIDSRGMETNIKLTYHDLKLFLGYTFTDAARYYSYNAGPWANPLTPKHRVNVVLMYELEEKWKLGLEGYYYSPQLLGDGTTGRDYWLCGFMAEKIWKRFSLFVNFENFLDVRQTRFDSIYFPYPGTPDRPNFKDIYAPLDGFVVNGGLKLNLL